MPDSAPSAPSLAELASATYRAGDGDGTDSDPVALHAAFLAATLYCERGDTPGFLALGGQGGGVVPVFTSPEQLARARGPVPYFSLRGADLLDQLPSGYDLLLDAGGEAPLRLRPSALSGTMVLDVQTGVRS